nr:DUF5895 domain-containing protein [Hassalia byssoidea]
MAIRNQGKTTALQEQTQETQNPSQDNSEQTQETQNPSQDNSEQRKSALSKFASPEYNAPISNICICQVINHMEAEKVGLFIKDKQLIGIDWKGSEPTHKHTFSSGTPEMGVLLQSPRLHILDISPRYIETRDEGEIIGIYESPNGYDMYQTLGKDKVVLRRFYFIYLVDEKNQNLHAKPIVLSIKGIASSKFGEAYKQFQRELEVAFAKYMGSSVAEKCTEFHRLGIFQPTFIPSHEPKDAPNPKDKSWVAVVDSYKSPKPDGSDFLEFFSEEKEAEFETLIQANPEFSHRIGKTSAVVAEHHRLVGVSHEMNALPSAPVHHTAALVTTNSKMEDLPY